MPDRHPVQWSNRSASMGYQINLLARLLAALLHREIVGHGVVPGQFAQLLALYDSDGQTPSELSRAVAIEPGTMTKTLVERRRAPGDGRSVTIHLTQRAKDLEPSLEEAAMRVNTRNRAAEHPPDRHVHAVP